MVVFSSRATVCNWVMGHGTGRVSKGPKEPTAFDPAIHVPVGGIKTQTPCFQPSTFTSILNFSSLTFTQKKAVIIKVQVREVLQTVHICGISAASEIEHLGPTGAPMLLSNTAPERGATLLTSHSISLMYFIYWGPA